MRRRWRWGVVGLLVACLAGLPAVVSAMPVNVSAVDPARLLGKVARSTGQPYQGYSVAQGTFSLPTLPLAGDVPALLSGTTYLRSWVASPTRWRVDAVDPFSETDMHTDGEHAWLWNSTRQRSTPVRLPTGSRLPRPADLLPPELGRRFAQAALGHRGGILVTTLKPRRVAGVGAAGLHLAPPPGSGTTIRAVDLWVDPHSGLPLDVEVYAGSATHAALGSHFLDLSQRVPSAATVAFTPGAGTQPRFGEFRRYRRFRFHDRGEGTGILDRLGGGPGGFGLPGAPDVVQVLSRLSSVRLPASLGGLTRRTPDGQGVATYGNGFSVVAVLGVAGSLDKRDTAMLGTLPSVATAAGPAHAVKTALLNGLIIDTGKTVYGLVGTVPVAQLQAMVGSLASTPGTTN